METSINNSKFIQQLKSDGFYNIRYIEGKGICALKEFIFTIGLCYGLDAIGYSGRYCYPKNVTANQCDGCNSGHEMNELGMHINSDSKKPYMVCQKRKYSNDANIALEVWNGKSEPIGNWVKHKGIEGEWTNANYKD